MRSPDGPRSGGSSAHAGRRESSSEADSSDRPQPVRLEVGSRIQTLIKDNFIGQLREYVVLGADDQFWDYSRPIHWRQDPVISGKNVLTLGIMHETVTRWVGAPSQVLSQSGVFETERPDPAINGYRECTVPDSVQILTQTPGGARGLYHLSGTVLFGRGSRFTCTAAVGRSRSSSASASRSSSAPRACRAERDRHPAVRTRWLASGSGVHRRDSRRRTGQVHHV